MLNAFGYIVIGIFCLYAMPSEVKSDVPTNSFLVVLFWPIIAFFILMNMVLDLFNENR